MGCNSILLIFNSDFILLITLSIVNISTGNISNTLFALHYSVFGTPYFDGVGIPVVPDIQAPTADGCLDEITPIAANNELHMGLPFLGHLEMSIMAFPHGGIVGATGIHTYTN